MKYNHPWTQIYTDAGAGCTTGLKPDWTICGYTIYAVSDSKSFYDFHFDPTILKLYPCFEITTRELYSQSS